MYYVLSCTNSYEFNQQINSSEAIMFILTLLILFLLNLFFSALEICFFVVILSINSVLDKN